MKELSAILEGIAAELDEKDEVRELALKSARALARLSSAAIAAMHRGGDVERYLADAQEEAYKLRAVLKDHPDLQHAGFVVNALQELCEAYLVAAIVDGRALPMPREIGATTEAYLLGLGDAVGELRRLALEHLRRGEIDEASSYLERMEAIHEGLLRFHYPHGLVAIRRKQDVVRGLVEKTRGEIAVATRGKVLEEKIDRLGKGT